MPRFSQSRMLVLFALGSVFALPGCKDHPAALSGAQALRTCVDRWNQANMVGWGPGPANVAFRRPNAKEHSRLLLPERRQCIVAMPAGDGTWTCVINTDGAYWCPPLHEPTGPPLPANATLDRRGVLVRNLPLKGTHPTPPLGWTRYPLVDGYIQPWASSGKLRPGLHVKGQRQGRCFLAAETARSAVSCLVGNFRYDACFPRRWPGRRADVAFCSFGPGSRNFTRWVITSFDD